MQELKEREKLEDAIKSSPCVLVQYGRESCMPCHGIKRKLGEWVREQPEACGIYVPLDQFPDLAAEAGIFTVPAVLLYVDGRLTKRESGYFSVDEILRAAERYLELLKE